MSTHIGAGSAWIFFRQGIGLPGGALKGRAWMPESLALLKPPSETAVKEKLTF